MALHQNLQALLSLRGTPGSLSPLIPKCIPARPVLLNLKATYTIRALPFFHGVDSDLLLSCNPGCKTQRTCVRQPRGSR